MPADGHNGHRTDQTEQRANPPRRDAFEAAWRARFVEFATQSEDDAGIAGWSPTGLETRFRFFRKLWRDVRGGARYLDVGCGAGTYARWLAEQGLNVIGVDYSHLALVKATRRGAGEVDYCVSDGGCLPFGGASVDGVICFGVLQAVRDSARIVQELARVVRPGGEVWIDALNATNPAASWERTRRKLKGKPMHLRYESSVVLMELMRAAGFKELSQHWLIILPRKLYVLHRAAESRPIGWLLRYVPGLGALLSHSILIRGVRDEMRKTGPQ